MELTTKRSIRWGALRVALMATILLLCAACGSDGDSATSATSAMESADFNVDRDGAAFDAADDAMDFDEAMEEQAFEAEGDDAEQSSLGSSGTAGANAAQIGVDPQALGREIIFSANLVVGVDDVAEAGAEAARIVAENGGLLFGQQTTSQGEAQSTLTFRVRPENFQATLDQLGGIGELRNQSVSAEDVTGRVVDLQSRISTSEASLERLRELIGNADDVEVLASVEGRLLERETELELLRGQLRSVRDRIDLATIVVTLTSAIPRPAIEVSVTTYQGHDDGVGCPGPRGSGFERDVEATLCFEVLNSGESPLTGISVEDTALGLESSDYTVVFGDLGGELLPGQSIVFATEVVPERTLRLRTRVTAVPLSADGDPLAQKSVNASVDNSYSVRDDGPPSIRDAFVGGWDVLKSFVQLLGVALAALIWFIWIPIAIWLFIRWRRRRSAAARAEKQAQAEVEREMRMRAEAEAHATVAARRAEAAAARTPPPPSAAIDPDAVQ